MKRKDALNIIKAEYAKHGKTTKAALRAYADDQVDLEAYADAKTAGMKIFNDEGNT